VQDALFGPPIVGSPERAEWEKARDRRAQEREDRRLLCPPTRRPLPNHAEVASHARHSGISRHADTRSQAAQAASSRWPGRTP
jgi:hypothetical protein